MRLIDADPVIELLRYDIEGLEKEFPDDKEAQACKCGEGMALAYIDTAPTIDAEPVRHGRWVLNTDMSMHCSECEEVFRFDDKDECLDFMEYAKFCIACGARMDGEDNDD